MRTIIAGSRNFTKEEVFNILNKPSNAAAISKISVVISGGARGVDNYGAEWAYSKGIPVEEYLADWSQGKQAGYVRNVKMAENADALIAIWDNKSKGTKHMIDIATAKCLKVAVVIPERYADYEQDY